MPSCILNQNGSSNQFKSLDYLIKAKTLLKTALIHEIAEQSDYIIYDYLEVILDLVSKAIEEM